MEDIQKTIFAKILSDQPIEDYIKSKKFDINYYPRSNIYYLNVNLKYDFNISDYSWTLAEFWIITKKSIPPICILPKSPTIYHNFIVNSKNKTKGLTLELLYKLTTGEKLILLNNKTKSCCVN